VAIAADIPAAAKAALLSCAQREAKEEARALSPKVAVLEVEVPTNGPAVLPSPDAGTLALAVAP
jgi:hypothetical protein